MWHTHKPNIHQPIRINGHKLPYLWQQFYITTPCIQLISTNSKPKLELSLPNPPPLTPPSPHQSHSLSHIKPLKVSLIWPWSNPPNFYILSNSSIVFKTKSPLKASFPCQIPSITDKVIAQGGVPVKDYILSISSYWCLTSDIKIIILGK